MRCSYSTTLVLHITTLLTLTFITTSVNGGHPQVLTGPRSWSSLLKKAFDLGRTAKWNEFIEEKNGVGGGGGGGPFSGDHNSSSPTKNGTNSSSSSSPSSFRKSTTSQHQNLIDETKDPDSPYYIAMISSNIGGGHSAAAVAQSTGNPIGTRNGSNNNSSGSSSVGGSKNKDNNKDSGLVSKLFSYAFAPSTPSRVMATTKRPLVTYINVSNLEEHEQVVENSASKLGFLSNPSSSSVEASQQQQQLQLLNNADHTGTGVLNHRDHSHPHHVHHVLSTAAAAAAASGGAAGSILASKRRLPECATQQVCAAHYVKSNHTQRLCECAQDFKWNCEDPNSHQHDHEPTHTIDLTRKQEYKTQRNNLEAYTQVKMCENLKSIKPCKTPTDWTIMALQSERTGKAHYVVVCKCPDEASFEGPFTHKHPPYARFPGIRVYGMLCNQGVRKSKDPKALEIDQNSEFPEFPWELAYAVINATTTQGFW